MSDARTVLEAARRIAVVGCSADPAKAAHRIPAWLQVVGYQVVPVNPHAERILGEQAYPSLADVRDPVDLVVVFRPADEAPGIVRSAIAARAGGVWLQLGIRSEEARQLAEEAGLAFVQDRCSGVDAETWAIDKTAA